MIAAEQENERAVLQIAGRPIGGPHFSLIAGPCTVESREQVLEAAQAVSDAAQQLPTAEVADYLERVRAVAAVVGKVLVS